MEEMPETAMQRAERPEEGPKRGRGKRTLLIVILSLLGLFLIMGICGGIYAWRFHRAWKGIVIENVDLSRVSDGVYEGEFRTFHDFARVRVTVQGHRIEAMEILENSPGGGTGKMEELAQRVVASQSPDVDIISGASASSKVFLKAVENALVQSEQ